MPAAAASKSLARRTRAMPKRRATAPASIVQGALVSFAVDPCTGPATANGRVSVAHRRRLRQGTSRARPRTSRGRPRATRVRRSARPAGLPARAGSARSCRRCRRRAPCRGRWAGVVALAIESRVPGRHGVEEAAPRGSRAQRWQNSGFGPRYAARSMPVRVLFAASECAPFVKTGGLARRRRPRCRRRCARSATTCGCSCPATRRCSPARARRGRSPRSARSRSCPAPGCVAGTTPSGVPLLAVVNDELYDRPGGPYQGPDRNRLRGQCPPLRPPVARGRRVRRARIRRYGGSRRWCTPTTGRPASPPPISRYAAGARAASC